MPPPLVEIQSSMQPLLGIIHPIGQLLDKTMDYDYMPLYGIRQIINQRPASWIERVGCLLALRDLSCA